MVITISPPLLLPVLVLLLSPNSGGVPCLALAAKTCNPSYFKNTQDIYDLKSIPLDNLKPGERHVSVYMNPQTAFKGVTIKIQTKDGQHKDWLNTTDNCPAPDYNSWLELKATLQITEAQNLDFLLQLGECACSCTVKRNLDSVQSLTIVTHGLLKWKKKYPQDCSVKEVKDTSTPTDGNCQEPSSPTTTTTTTTTSKERTTNTANGATMILAMIPVMIIVMMIILGVIWKRRRDGPSTPLQMADEDGFHDYVPNKLSH